MCPNASICDYHAYLLSLLVVAKLIPTTAAPYSLSYKKIQNLLQLKMIQYSNSLTIYCKTKQDIYNIFTQFYSRTNRVKKQKINSRTELISMCMYPFVTMSLVTMPVASLLSSVYVPLCWVPPRWR